MVVGGAKQRPALLLAIPKGIMLHSPKSGAGKSTTHFARQSSSHYYSDNRTKVPLVVRVVTNRSSERRFDHTFPIPNTEDSTLFYKHDRNYCRS